MAEKPNCTVCAPDVHTPAVVRVELGWTDHSSGRRRTDTPDLCGTHQADKHREFRRPSGAWRPVNPTYRVLRRY